MDAEKEKHPHQEDIHEAGGIIQTWISLPVVGIGMRRKTNKVLVRLRVALLAGGNQIRRGDGRSRVRASNYPMRAMAVGAASNPRKTQGCHLPVKRIPIGSQRFAMAGPALAHDVKSPGLYIHPLDLVRRMTVRANRRDLTPPL